jgi:hypothetical protein
VSGTPLSLDIILSCVCEIRYLGFGPLQGTEVRFSAQLCSPRFVVPTHGEGAEAWLHHTFASHTRRSRNSIHFTPANDVEVRISRRSSVARRAPTGHLAASQHH